MVRFRVIIIVFCLCLKKAIVTIRFEICSNFVCKTLDALRFLIKVATHLGNQGGTTVGTPRTFASALIMPTWNL